MIKKFRILSHILKKCRGVIKKFRILSHIPKTVQVWSRSSENCHIFQKQYRRCDQEVPRLVPLTPLAKRVRMRLFPGPWVSSPYGTMNGPKTVFISDCWGCKTRHLKQPIYWICHKYYHVCRLTCTMLTQLPLKVSNFIYIKQRFGSHLSKNTVRFQSVNSVEQFPDINKLCNVASSWIYEYIGILLGARPILHISRIKFKL
jgi:hypothetical protein